MSVALAADKRRPPMTFHGRTGYNNRPRRRVGCCAEDAGAGWRTECARACPKPPLPGD
eukprot:CAMPEP_0202003338 /NCGR_PEP_ID=MMETSP0905-20130828/8952_1 /ASSEMBLY_ACC=CAM_ASM_000554 /TAXON_ID=420261 /ORGANISM="Thalassiosira antarctica, Strain CCMP982" /LENGTH=57 /DNA_ID=CAMNT_0048560465 /DNA_START=289 /DNA_END=459 /DNA_ORIENTATION=+